MHIAILTFEGFNLATWMIARLEGTDAARSAMHYVAPVGEKDDYVSRAMANIEPYLDGMPVGPTSSA
jgi:hypothetical protein